MKQNGNFLFLTRILLIAGLYFVAGRIGLYLAVPPGYATVIWPPSGIAIGALILFGWRYWPGILAGSFLLNCYTSGAYSPETGADLAKAATALAIAVGSTLQALGAYWLIKRFLGIPLSFSRIREVALLFVLAGPVACIMAASIGVMALYLSGSLPAEQAATNWLTWWMGDVFGIIVFLPLMLLAPWKSQPLQWRGSAVGKLPAASLVILLIPLGLTFYAWAVSARAARDNSEIQFDALTIESKRALVSRINSYDNALLGGVAYFQGSNRILREEWRRYTEMLDLQENFPGINGIGWITLVADADIEQFLEITRADGVPNFEIHPKDVEAGNYVITYIEPEKINRQAIGLNIAFEKNRKEAADLSRKTGKPAITKRIILVQDEEKTPGFLLLHPMYKDEFEPRSPGEKLAVFDGWIYAPFIAKNFMRGLTESQGNTINLRVYDGDKEDPEALIYDGRKVQSDDFKPAFSKREQIKVMQQKWLIVWESTLGFEQGSRTSNPILILTGGLLITFLLGMFLIVSNIRRTETFESLLGRKALILPVLVFSVLSVGSVLLYRALTDKELSYIQSLVASQTSKIDLLISSETAGKIGALKRMATRTELNRGKVKLPWRADAQTYINDLEGLRVLGWVDSDGVLIDSQESPRNERSLWIDVLMDGANKAIAESAIDRDIPKLTPPMNLTDEQSAFVAYFPLSDRGTPAGYIASVFSVEEFFEDNISREALERYQFRIDFGGETRIRFGNLTGAVLADWEFRQPVQILDRTWNIVALPTAAFLNSQRTQLPTVALIAGFLIALLSALTAHMTLLSRLKTAYLEESNDLIKQEAIRNSTVMNTVSDSVLTINAEGVIETINPAGLRMFGYSEKEVLGKNIKLLMPEAYAAHHDDYMATYMATGNRKVIGIGRQVSALRKDGRVFPIDLSVNEMFLDDKRMFVGTIRDTSEAVAAAQALQASDSLKAAILASTEHMIIVTDMTGIVMVMNEAAENALGYKAEEIVGKQTPALWHDPEEIAERARELTSELDFPVKANFEVFTRPVKFKGIDEHDWTFIRKDGSRFPVQLALTALRNDDQRITGYVAVILDITKRKEVDRLKSEFVSVVSHELRTPLTSIRGALGLVAGPLATELPEKANRLIDIAYKNCERLTLLINDILDIDKIESGQMRFEMKPEDLDGLLRQAVEVNQPYAEKLGVKLATGEIEPGVTAKVDAARFAQVLANLLSNAAKFSHRGGTVDVSARRLNNMVRISVRDYGSGISEEFRPQIFGRFSQGDSSSTRVKGGSGLGLHISKQIVERMGGTIGFETDIGKGTTFWVDLPPLEGAHVAATTGRTDLERSLLHYKQRSPRTLLHVEDDEDLSRIIAMSLQGKVEVVTATTLKEGERLLRQRRFDLVVLDLELPDGSGLDILKTLSELAVPPIPVMILSASEVSSEIEKTVASAIVKSRSSEAKIIEKIESIIAG